VSTIVLLPGDGIGPEVVAAAANVLDAVAERFSLDIQTESHPIGGAALRDGLPALPEATLAAGRAADAVLLGAVGNPAFDHLAPAERPEGGLLALRRGLGVYANLRPTRVWPGCDEAGPLKPELSRGADLLIVRELTGGLYFGQPRGFAEDGAAAFNTMRYSTDEVARIARVAFEAARRRRKHVTSVDKANVLEVSQLWRRVVTEVAASYSDVVLSHMYVDSCAMALVTAPARFDVLLTENMFGDILSDEAAVIAGSIGLLPSASIGDGPGLYEPVHGSAPDIAGTDRANPAGAILSLAMLLEHSLDEQPAARAIEQAVGRVLAAGTRTSDLASGGPAVGCQAFADQVIAALRAS
jgi:3-isopropylmalate dehydrogenase